MSCCLLCISKRPIYSWIMLMRSVNFKSYIVDTPVDFWGNIKSLYLIVAAVTQVDQSPAPLVNVSMFP